MDGQGIEPGFDVSGDGWDSVKPFVTDREWAMIQTRVYRAIFEQPLLPVDFDPAERLSTYALLGLELNLRGGNVFTMDVGLAAWFLPTGWQTVRVDEPAYGFQILDESGAALVQGVVDVQPRTRTVVMALTDAGRRVARERWDALSWWGRRKLTRQLGSPWSDATR
ncbi:hypothetical protein ACFRMQ_00600 [Kitasatospora sp. NPDC056783]|uniref:hypothetical protein n=1 Tax=Kitasatospora sp. NPDC056783 TaxID=3345943 RepID=UPI00369B5F3A